MSVLSLRLAGPMQSWGTQSRFTVRDTGLEPSKSGVAGLLCAALGRPRGESVNDLASLRMGVRVDREGTMLRDYHTAGGTHLIDETYGVPTADGSSRRTITSNRYYLADADFLVGLEGERTFLEQLDHAVRHPVWPLFLGRKSFVPGRPVHLPDGLRDGTVEAVLRAHPWHYRSERERDNRPERLRLVLEDETGASAEVRMDRPVSFELGIRRQYMARHVRTEWVDLTPDMLEEDQLCISLA